MESENEVKTAMNYDKIKAKMDAFFASATPEQIIKQLEEIGLVFTESCPSTDLEQRATEYAENYSGLTVWISKDHAYLSKLTKEERLQNIELHEYISLTSTKAGYLQALSDLGQVKGWISVKDGLPDARVDVLAFTNDLKRIVQTDWESYTSKNREWFIESFSHWRPMIETPTSPDSIIYKSISKLRDDKETCHKIAQALGFGDIYHVVPKFGCIEIIGGNLCLSIYFNGYIRLSDMNDDRDGLKIPMSIVSILISANYII